MGSSHHGGDFSHRRQTYPILLRHLSYFWDNNFTNGGLEPFHEIVYKLVLPNNMSSYQGGFPNTLRKFSIIFVSLRFCSVHVVICE